jgi:hypothetical protein
VEDDGEGHGVGCENDEFGGVAVECLGCCASVRDAEGLLTRGMEGGIVCQM